MSNRIKAPTRAPYLVFVEERLVARACNLAELYDELVRIRTQQQEAYEARRLARFAPGAQPWHDLDQPRFPQVQVIDNRSCVREDLSSPGQIYWGFARGGRLDNIVDYGWDGDLRPRGAPIPHTGAHRFRHRHTLRYPRTQSDRRKAYPVFEDGEPPMRGARTRRALPTCWDDIPRKSFGDKCWKRYRKTQWRG